MPTTTRRPTKRRTAKKAPRKRTAKKATRRPAPKKTLSAAHKKALAEGRTISNTVDRYLQLVNAPKRRGRKVSTDSIKAKITKLSREAKSPGVKSVLAIQEMRDLEKRLASMSESGNGASVKQAEDAFVKIAKKFGENRGVGYGAWRDAGVPAIVLKRAGIERTRS